MTHRLVLASVQDPVRTKLFDELSRSGLPADELPDYLPQVEGQRQHVWPLSSSFDNDIALARGDYVLFRTEGDRYKWAAEITGVTRDPEGADDQLTSRLKTVVCGDDADIQVDDYIGSTVLLLDIPFRIDLRTETFHKQVGVSDEPVAGSLIPDAADVETVIDDYGSFERFLEVNRQPPRVFIELTSVETKPYKRADGAPPLGSALISPAEVEDDPDASRMMEEPEVGDIVLHITEEVGELRGYSLVAGDIQSVQEAHPDEDWPDRPSYYRPLGKYHGFEDPIDTRARIFQNDSYQSILSDLLDEDYEYLPYTETFDFNQRYFLQCPLQLLYLFIVEQPGLLEQLRGLHWVIRQPGEANTYRAVSEAETDILLRLPFTEYSRDWLEGRITARVLTELEPVLDGLTPDSTLEQSAAAICELLAAVYDDVEPALTAAAEDIQSASLSKLNEPQTLFLVLLRELQRRFKLEPSMDIVRLRTVLESSYDVAQSGPGRIPRSDENEPLSPGQEVANAAEIRRQLVNTGQMVFYGPPGTGKTWTAKQFARWWLNEETDGEAKKRQLETVTFHPSFSYEDFIEGLRADNVDGDLVYDEQPGTFATIAKKAANAYYTADDGEDPRKFALIIDEINRGNLAQIFGETITGLEYDKRLGQENETTLTLAHSGDSFTIPPNLYVIGTMNTADRSIALVDAALRRRFRFLGFPPDFNTVRDANNMGSWDEVQQLATGPSKSNQLLAKSLLAARVLNARILNEPDLGRGKQVGHSFFFNQETEQAVRDTWRFEILPLFEEYYFGQYGRIQESLFRGRGDELFDWDSEQIKGFEISDLHSALNPLVEAHPPTEP